MAPAKHGSLNEITNILNSCPENLPINTVLEMKERKKTLFNEKGNLKWNAVHFAVFCGNLDILKYFIDQ